MIVRIGDMVYSSDDEMIMIVLSAREQTHVADRLGTSRTFGFFPKGASEEEIQEFMEFGHDD